MPSPNLSRASITVSAEICAAARAPERADNVTCPANARSDACSRRWTPSRSKTCWSSGWAKRIPARWRYCTWTARWSKTPSQPPHAPKRRKWKMKSPLNCRSPKRTKALTLVNFITGHQRLVEHVAVPQNTNEEAAVAAHFPKMDLAGLCLTADAAHTTKANARQLTQGNGADYLLSLKGNQPLALAKAQQLLTGSFPPCGSDDRQGPRSH